MIISGRIANNIKSDKKCDFYIDKSAPNNYNDIAV